MGWGGLMVGWGNILRATQFDGVLACVAVAFRVAWTAVPVLFAVAFGYRYGGV